MNRDPAECSTYDGPFWYEVIERLPVNTSAGTSNNSNGTSSENDDKRHQLVAGANNEVSERVIALFQTEKEAMDCARLKQFIRIRSKREKGFEDEERYLVRRRMN